MNETRSRVPMKKAGRRNAGGPALGKDREDWIAQRSDFR